ncbi:MAG: hypothetical protein HYT88_00010 [Candidatus Omnitrophica bacterium]|nr:hypothetical protein [Candidatus Omnitrophota bacterium]MBI2173935.1 hypothetical protein [Candidatus Omnitrophota bacterium]MBI3009734.1 hypothetical protein [Candidatus Omnitrophota bacterium]
MTPTPAGGSAAAEKNRIFGTAGVDRQWILSMEVNPRLCQKQSLQQVRWMIPTPAGLRRPMCQKRLKAKRSLPLKLLYRCSDRPSANQQVWG